jgi:Ca2+-binding RTX toxin-like protein
MAHTAQTHSLFQIGTEDDDVLLFTAFRKKQGYMGVDGGAGNDHIEHFVSGTSFGDIGNDTMIGSRYNDTFYGEDGNDQLIGNSGADTLMGGAGDDVMDGGRGRDSLYGGNGDDQLMGGAGNDYLSGGFGNDRLESGDGVDTLFGGAGDDIILAYGTNVSATIYGGAGNDIIQVDNGDHTIDGGAGDDIVRVGEGDSVVNLGAGNDYLEITSVGQSGSEISIRGGVGADTYQITRINDMTLPGHDVFNFNDFNTAQGDTLKIGGINVVFNTPTFDDNGMHVVASDGSTADYLGITEAAYIGGYVTFVDDSDFGIFGGKG